MLPQTPQSADKLRHIVFAAEPRPIDPADLVVLAIGVVVAALAVADLVAGQDQRHALREQQGGSRLRRCCWRSRGDLRLVGRPLGAAIGAVVVVRSVRCSSPLASLCFCS